MYNELAQNVNYSPGDTKDHTALGMVISNDIGDILTLYHDKWKFWTIPVGKCEPNQTVEQGLKSELQEELSIQPASWSILANKQHSYLRNGNTANVDLHIITIHSYSGTIKNCEPHKHSAFGFRSLKEIQQLNPKSDALLLMLHQLIR